MGDKQNLFSNTVLDPVKEEPLTADKLADLLDERYKNLMDRRVVSTPYENMVSMRPMEFDHKREYEHSLHKRIKELEDGIKEHAKDFPDEPLEGETKLWALVGIKVPMDSEGRFFKGK